MIDVLKDTLWSFLEILPILIAAVVVGQVVAISLPKERIQKAVSNKRTAYVKSSAFGLLSPGPLLAYLPTLKILKDKGISLGIIASFITAQTLIGPARLFVEIGYFGIVFFLLRTILAFFMALIIGNIFRILFSKKGAPIKKIGGE